MRYREDLYDRDAGYASGGSSGFFHELYETYANSIYLQLSLVYVAFCIGRCWWQLRGVKAKGDRESIWFQMFLGLALSVAWPIPLLANVVHYIEARRENRKED